MQTDLIAVVLVSASKSIEVFLLALLYVIVGSLFLIALKTLL